MTADPWGVWRRAELSAGQREMTKRFDIEPAHVWRNEIYEVWAYELGDGGGMHPPMVWLSIKRHDREPLRDWRELQRIKNELVGRECEAVELFPAESRLVDTSNQFHLWCLTNKRDRFPFGYQARAVVLPGDSEVLVGSKQREFGPTHEQPTDAVTAADMDEFIRKDRR